VECKGGDNEDLPQLDGIDNYNGRRPRPYDRPNDAGDTTTHGARASQEDAQARTAEHEASDEDLPHFSHDIDDNSDYNGRHPLPHDCRDSGHETIRNQHEGDQGSNEGEDNGDGHHAENIDRRSLDRNSRLVARSLRQRVTPVQMLTMPEPLPSSTVQPAHSRK